MLRTLIVIALVAVGAFYALQAPFYALLLYIGNAYFRPEDWVWTDLIRNLNLSLISGLFVLLASLFSRHRFILNGRLVLILLFLVHSFLSLLQSEYFSYGWPYWQWFAKSVMISYLIVVLVMDFAQLRLLLLVMVLALGLLEAKQGWFYLLYPPSWAGGNPNTIAFLGDNNGVAIGMLMLVPVIDFLAQTAQRKWARHFYRFLLVGVLFRAISTYSRGGFLACIALGAGYLFRSQQKFRVLIAMGVLLVVVLPALPDSFWDRMRTIQTYTEEESALSRLHFWKVAAEMANANPLLGVGFNAYNEAYDTYDFSHGRYGKGRSVHSSYYSIVAELGYTGLLLYGLIVFGAIRGCNRVHRLAKRGSIPAELGKSAFALEMSLFVFLCGGSFVIFQYNEMLWHFFGLTIVLEHLAARSPEKQSSDVSPEPSLSYALASQE